MVSIKKRHLCGGLQPDFSLSVSGKQIEALYCEPKLTGLGEFADAGAEGHQAFSGNVGGSLHQGFAHVVNAVLVKAEAVESSGLAIGAFGGRALDYVLKVGAHEFVEFFEDNCGFLLVQGPHPGDKTLKILGYGKDWCSQRSPQSLCAAGESMAVTAQNKNS